MGDSIFRKIGKILEKPEVPAHIRARNYEVTIPWYRTVLEALKPPSAGAGQKPGFTPSQLRLLKIGSISAVLLLAGWWTYDYVSSAPQRAQAAFDAGLILTGPGDFKGAVAKFTDSITIVESPKTYVERGNAYRAMGEIDKALSDWQHAIDLDGKFVDAYTARGTYYRIIDNMPEAMSNLDKSIQISPTVDAYYQRGQVYAAQNQLEKALDDYNRAIELKRDSPFVYLARAVIRNTLGDAVGAKEDQDVAFRLQSGQ